MSLSIQCPYCRRAAKLVDASEVYGRNWPKGGKLWLCRPCEAWVGCHRGSAVHKPLGRLANAELRRWKQKAHDAFDRLWRDGAMSRKGAYAWMAQAMGIPAEKAHIGMFGVDQCRKLIEILRARGHRLMNSHLRVLEVFRDGQARSADFVFVKLPNERYCGRVCKDLVADGCLECVGPGVNYRITDTGRRRLARAPIGAHHA